MTWKLNNKFSYPKSMRSIYNGSRHYDVEGDKYPSATSILGATKSQKDIDALNRWKKDIGYSVAAAVSKQSSDRGTEMHSWIESMLLFRANGELLEETNLPKKWLKQLLRTALIIK